MALLESFAKLNMRRGGDGRGGRPITAMELAAQFNLEEILEGLTTNYPFSTSFFLVLSLAVKFLISIIWSRGLPGFMLENKHRVFKKYHFLWVQDTE